ncbi:MAG: T9SS type A sorting domain-containing protein, partial [Bacteroidota bacterium]
ITIYGAAASTGIDTLVRGDQISVRGVVIENFSRTELKVVSILQVIGRNVAVPAPATMSISGSGSVSYALSNPPVDGNATFEKWEGVLVSITGPYLIIRNADNLAGGSGSNFGEFFIGSSKTTSYGLRVDDAGTNRYYADTSASYTAKPSDAILIPRYARIATLSGIVDWSFSFYKLLPRTDADFGTITGVERVDDVPSTFALSQNYPNPFNPSTTIRYSLLQSARVTLKVFNMLGQEVATLANGEHPAGTFQVTFDASHLASGVYYYQLRAGDLNAVQRMVYLK